MALRPPQHVVDAPRDFPSQSGKTESYQSSSLLLGLQLNFILHYILCLHLSISPLLYVTRKSSIIEIHLNMTNRRLLIFQETPLQSPTNPLTPSPAAHGIQYQQGHAQFQYIPVNKLGLPVHGPGSLPEGLGVGSLLNLPLRVITAFTEIFNGVKYKGWYVLLFHPSFYSLYNFLATCQMEFYLARSFFVFYFSFCYRLMVGLLIWDAQGNCSGRAV